MANVAKSTVINTITGGEVFDAVFEVDDIRSAMA
jgi:ribosome biogenesis GTPase A